MKRCYTLCRCDLPYAILFTNPECMTSKPQNIFKTWSNVGKLSFVAVDEAPVLMCKD